MSRFSSNPPRRTPYFVRPPKPRRVTRSMDAPRPKPPGEEPPAVRVEAAEFSKKDDGYLVKASAALRKTEEGPVLEFAAHPGLRQLRLIIENATRAKMRPVRIEMEMQAFEDFMYDMHPSGKGVARAMDARGFRFDGVPVKMVAGE